MKKDIETLYIEQEFKRCDYLKSITIRKSYTKPTPSKKVKATKPKKKG